MRFGLDLDGVCYHWTEIATRLIRDQYGVDVGPSTSWGWMDSKTTPEMRQWLWTDGITNGLFRRGSTFPGTREAVRDLYLMGWTIVVITTRPELATCDTLRWLGQTGIPAREVHMLNHGVLKSTVPCDLYLDDHVDHVNDVAGAGHDALLWTRLYNEKAELHPNVRRVECWGEVLSAAERRLNA